ncbi:MAG: YajQ family cyclic di-GMP-binding protein [Fusobacteria bacterium]|nr:YajQ family cyclic di-GMP-binding protein [Fusobacteriota bacterium]
MGKDASFDIVSEFDFQELDNAINQTKKEIITRYDFKGTKAEVNLAKESITLIAENDNRINAIVDILQSKAIKRGLSIKIFDYGKIEPSGGSMVKQVINLRQGINQDIAKSIVKEIKASGLKVQSQIQGDVVRVTAKNIDDLQKVITLLKEKDLNIPLQFVNYRS